MKRKKTDGFSLDFSALTFNSETENEYEEIPKLSTQPAAFENAEPMVGRWTTQKIIFALFLVISFLVIFWRR